MGFFSKVLLKQPLKFLLNSLPSLLTSPRDGQSQPLLQKLFRSFFIMGGGALKFCNPSGDHKNFIRAEGQMTKSLQNF